MLRRLIPLLLALGASGATLTAQDLEVWFLDVGQGDATLLRSPTGQTFLLDGGENGMGYAVVVPLLQSLGVSQLDYVGASHYHADHVGGLDEVWNAGIHASVALDRGTSNTPGTQSYQDYASRYAGVRQTVQPGQVVNLGGGVTLTCLVVEGRLMGGGSVNIGGSSQWENSASIAWLVEYGDFDLFLGGDLTGGGNGTTDVESSVAPLAGDVEVYQANHHGSRTSSNSAFVNTIRPEFVVFPCGSANVYGFPKQEVIDRLNTASRCIPLWSLTDGVGTEGFVDAGGTVHLATDGNTWTVTAPDGTAFTATVDEQAPGSPAAGDLVVAEFHRDPNRSSDTDGEWIEITGARTTEVVSLRSVNVGDGASDSFTLGTSIVLDAGDECVLAADGLPSRNGGLRPTLVWPAGRMSLQNSSDSIRLQRISIVLDQVDYDASWPGGNGVAAERKDLLGPPAASNFAGAVSSYGSGDKGTPGRDNDADITNWGGGGGSSSWVEIVTPPARGGLFDMYWHMPGEYTALYQGFCTLSTTPGFDLNGTHIPGNQDVAYRQTYGLPGWSGLVPVNEVQYVSAQVPNSSKLAGLNLYVLFYTYKDIIGQGITVRTVADPVAVTIQ